MDAKIQSSSASSVSEIGAAARGQPVRGRQTDQERVLHQVDAFGTWELAALRGGVLVADGDVELAAEEARVEGGSV